MSTSWRRPSGVACLAALVTVLAAAAPASAAPPSPGALKLNEVESTDASVTDFVELINTGPIAEIGGYVIKDNDDGHVFTISAGTTIAAGGYYVADTDTGPSAFGLGSADSARLFEPGGTVLLDAYSWTAHAPTTYGRCPNGTGAFATTAASTRGAANDCGAAASDVRINEVESSDPSVADFVELINTGAATDIGGYVIKDNDDTHIFTVPAGTTIPAGGYYVVDPDGPGGFGLGSADSARLFAAGGSTLVDSYSWTAHAATTYGRCPNGTGAFTTTTASTRGAANICPGDVIALPWPGGSAVATADGVNVFGTNLSGLAYQPSGNGTRGVLWAVRNGPGTLYRLIYDGTKWTPDTANGWGAGKLLRYPDGTGDPDAEGVTLVGNDPANGIFVSTERNNNASGTSRPAVLRFDVSSPATTLVATRDWNLTPDLPGLGANLGLEAIQWIADDFLVAKGFKDELTGAAYNPANYPNHGTGLFLVGVEQNGAIYAYALNQATGAYSRIATIASGFTGVMDLEFEPESQHLWVVCDDTCSGRSATLDIAQTGANAGKFVVTDVYERPAGMANLNNEGFAITPQAECVAGRKPVFWSDDNNTDAHALRSGTLNCTAPQAITFAQPAPIPFGSAPVALTASSTSGLTVSFSASGPCAVSGATLTVSGVGSCTVTASQPGNATTAPATPVVRTVAITKAPTSVRQRPVSLLGSLFGGLRVRYAAVLTSDVTGKPIAGQTIAFGTSTSATGPAACTAVTDGAGSATCTSSPLGLLQVLLTGSTTARYAGSASYQPSSSTTSVRLL